MPNYKIALACRNNDRVNAIIRGQVKPEGIDLQVKEMDSVPRMVERMFKGEYDVSEFSLAEFVYYTSPELSRKLFDLFAKSGYWESSNQRRKLIRRLSQRTHGPMDSKRTPA